MQNVRGLIEPGALYQSVLYVNFGTGIVDCLSDLAALFIPGSHFGLVVRPDEGGHKSRIRDLHLYHGDQAVLSPTRYR